MRPSNWKYRATFTSLPPTTWNLFGTYFRKQITFTQSCQDKWNL